MLWPLALVLTLAAGWFLARTLTAGALTGPRWASLLAEISLAVLFGPGLASVLYFGMIAAGVAGAVSVLAMLAIFTAGCAVVWWFITSRDLPAPVSGKRFSWTWVLWICVALGLVFFLMDFQAASSGNPNGEWDAMAVWNLRARFLAAGASSAAPGLWHRAVSSGLSANMAGAAHPGYPLFLSGFIALQWTTAGTMTGSFDAAVPIAASLLIALATFLLLGSSLASRKSVALGLLAWSVLLASEVFASQTATQYSDLLQGLAFLAALVLLDAAAVDDFSPRVLVAAGLACGLACWIKNEGLPFTIAALGFAIWRFRARAIPWLALGAAPGIAALAILKLFVAQGSEAIFPSTLAEALAKVAGAGRWWQAALGFAKAVYEAGAPWTHPVLLAALLVLALRFVPSAERRAQLWLWGPVAAVAAAEYGLYLITTADLDWHISTSVSRLVAQMWPSLIWLFFLMLRTPEECTEEALPETKSKRR